jgi:hypothetical protein
MRTPKLCQLAGTETFSVYQEKAAGFAKISSRKGMAKVLNEPNYATVNVFGYLSGSLPMLSPGKMGYDRMVIQYPA